MSNLLQHRPAIDGSGRHQPLVSIIIVVFNALKELRALIDSVAPHKNVDVEVIVVDGGSKDGTVEYLRDHGDVIDQWLSEPDRGIYDAMNKAIAIASGTYLLHLNAGDSLIHLPMQELKEANANGLDVAAFRVALDETHEFRPSCGGALRYKNTLHHQGTFFRRETFPGYDDRFRIFADLDANQKLARSGARMKTYTSVVARHTTDGVSNQSTSQAASEHFGIIAKNSGRSALPIAWMLCKWHGIKKRLGSPM